MTEPKPLYVEIDMVYGTMTWTSVWSDGRNVPLGLKLPPLVQALMSCPDYYPPGLYLFAAEGGAEPIDNGQPYQAGIQVEAYTRRHAIALFREQVALNLTRN